MVIRRFARYGFLGWAVIFVADSAIRRRSAETYCSDAEPGKPGRFSRMCSTEVRVLVRNQGGVDVGTIFEFQEWQARSGRRLTDGLRCKRVLIVEHFIGLAVQQDSPVIRTPLQCLQLKYFSRAVACERVVPGGVIVTSVGEGRVVEQEIACRPSSVARW